MKTLSKPPTTKQKSTQTIFSTILKSLKKPKGKDNKNENEYKKNEHQSEIDQEFKNKFQKEIEKLKMAQQPKKLFIVPDNDAEALSIIEILNQFHYPLIIMHKDWGDAGWDKLSNNDINKITEYQKNGYDIYGIELKGQALENCQNIDHHYYSGDNRFNIKSSIEQVSELINHKMTTFERFVAANDKGYMFEMNKLSKELQLSDDEAEKYIAHVNSLENKAKNVSNEDISNIRKIIDNAYVYDDRFIIIDLDDFSKQRLITDELYRMGKYKTNIYGNVLINSTDKNGNNRLVFFGSDENIDFLRNGFADTSIHWVGGQQGYGYFGIQIDESKGENFDEMKKLVTSVLEKKILGYNRIVEQKDIDKTICVKEASDSVPTMIHEINSPETFYNAINQAKQNNPYGAFVDLHDKVDYESDKLLLVNAGCAGCAVTNDGDIISLFKNEKMAKSDDIEKITTALFKEALAHGGQTLDCFDGFLPANYIKNGMIPVCAVKFSIPFAPENWDYQRDGMPNVVFMVKNPNINLDDLPLDVSPEDVNNLMSTIPVFNGANAYDQAIEYRENALNQFRKKDVEQNNECVCLFDDGADCR